MNWIFFALLNVMGAGTAIFLTKRLMKKTKIAYAGIMFATLSWSVIGFIPLVIQNYLQHRIIFSHIEGFGFYLIAVLITMAGFYTYFRALSLHDLSTVGPLENIRPFFVVIYSMFLLQQQPTPLLLVGIIFIIAGALVLQIQRSFWSFLHSIFHSKGTFWIILSTAIFGLGSIFDKKTLGYTTPVIYSFLDLLGISLFYGLLHKVQTKKFFPKKFISLQFIIVGLLWTLSYFGIMTAFSLATPNVVTPIQMTRSLYLSFLGFLFLGEKGYLRKLTAALLILIGAILIVI